MQSKMTHNLPTNFLASFLIFFFFHPTSMMQSAATSVSTVLLNDSVAVGKASCTSSNQSIPHLHQWQNPIEPCETLICFNGQISTHISSCVPINCPLHHRIRLPDACCETCDQKSSKFCDDDENRDCDIACRFDFARDDERNCDLCRCTRGKTSTTSTTTEKIEIHKEERDLEVLVIFILAFVTIFLFGCFLMILIWIVRVKMYKRIPLIGQRQDLKRGSNCLSETNSTSVSGCESV